MSKIRSPIYKIMMINVVIMYQTWDKDLFDQDFSSHC